MTIGLGHYLTVAACLFTLQREGGINSRSRLSEIVTQILSCRAK